MAPGPGAHTSHEYSVSLTPGPLLHLRFSAGLFFCRPARALLESHAAAAMSADVVLTRIPPQIGFQLKPGASHVTPSPLENLTRAILLASHIPSPFETAILSPLRPFRTPSRNLNRVPALRDCSKCPFNSSFQLS
jgi:hypothetical protein